MADQKIRDNLDGTINEIADRQNSMLSFIRKVAKQLGDLKATLSSAEGNINAVAIDFELLSQALTLIMSHIDKNVLDTNDMTELVNGLLETLQGQEAPALRDTVERLSILSADCYIVMEALLSSKEMGEGLFYEIRQLRVKKESAPCTPVRSRPTDSQDVDVEIQEDDGSASSSLSGKSASPESAVLHAPKGPTQALTAGQLALSGNHQQRLNTLLTAPLKTLESDTHRLFSEPAAVTPLTPPSNGQSKAIFGTPNASASSQNSQQPVAQVNPSSPEHADLLAGSIEDSALWAERNTYRGENSSGGAHSAAVASRRRQTLPIDASANAEASGIQRSHSNRRRVTFSGDVDGHPDTAPRRHPVTIAEKLKVMMKRQSKDNAPSSSEALAPDDTLDACKDDAYQQEVQSKLRTSGEQKVEQYHRTTDQRDQTDDVSTDSFLENEAKDSDTTNNTRHERAAVDSQHNPTATAGRAGVRNPSGASLQKLARKGCNDRTEPLVPTAGKENLSTSNPFIPNDTRASQKRTADLVTPWLLSKPTAAKPNPRQEDAENSMLHPIRKPLPSAEETSHLVDTISDLSCQLKSVKAALEEEKRCYSAQQGEITEILGEFSNAQDAYTAEKAQMQQEIDRLKVANSALTAKSRAAEVSSAAADKQLAGLRAELQSEKQLAESLRKQLACAEEIAHRPSPERPSEKKPSRVISEYASQIAGLRAELEARDKTINALRGQLAGVEHDLAQHNSSKTRPASHRPDSVPNKDLYEQLSRAFASSQNGLPSTYYAQFNNRLMTLADSYSECMQELVDLRKSHSELREVTDNYKFLFAAMSHGTK